MTDFSDFFVQLFTGTGSYLGLLIVVVLMIFLVAINKYAGVLSFIIGMLLGFYYMDASLGFHAIASFITSLFCIMYVALGKGKG